MGSDESVHGPLEGEIPRSRDEQGERKSEEVKEKTGAELPGEAPPDRSGRSGS